MGVTVRSGRLVAWTRAWQAGLVSYDDVLDSTEGTDRPHLVTGALGDVTLGRFVLEVRGEMPRLVLPVPGDPRGLPGPGPFSDHALGIGEAVLTESWGLVPQVQLMGGAPGGRRAPVRWHSYAVPAAAPDQLSLAEAEHDLAAAVRETAAALRRLDVARTRPEIARAVAALREPGGDREDDSADEPALPPGYPARAHHVLALADRIGAILRLAAADAPGAAVTVTEALARGDLLRSVETAARRARLAAYNAGVPGRRSDGSSNG